MNMGPKERHKAGKIEASAFLPGKKSIWPDPPLNSARAGMADLHKQPVKKYLNNLRVSLLSGL